MSSRASFPKTSHIFSRDLRKNGSWLLFVSLILLLAEPFALYLTGITRDVATTGSMWSGDFDLVFTQIARLQVIFVAAFLLLAVCYLAYRIYSFCADAGQNQLWFSLPIKRSRLFFVHYLAGLILILLPLFLDVLAMGALFGGIGPEHAPLFQEWCRLRLNFISPLISFYNIAILSMTLSSGYGSALAFLVTWEVVLPASLGLISLYFSESAGGYIPQILSPLTEQLIYCLAPPIRLFMNKAPEFPDLAYSLVIMAVTLFLALRAFCRRPLEKTRLRLSELSGARVLAALWLIMAGFAGGYFFEVVAGSKILIVFILGFLAFNFWVALIFQAMTGKTFKQGARSVLKTLVIALACFIAFDLLVELYPVERSRSWDIEAIEIPLYQLYDNGSPWQLPSSTSVKLERSVDDQLLEDLSQKYKQSQRYAQRQGFILNRRNSDFACASYSSHNYQRNSYLLTFYDQSGKSDQGYLNEDQAGDMLQKISNSEIYGDLIKLQRPDYVSGDRAYLQITAKNLTWYEMEQGQREEKEQSLNKVLSVFPDLQSLESTDPIQKSASRHSVFLYTYSLPEDWSPKLMEACEADRERQLELNKLKTGMETQEAYEQAIARIPQKHSLEDLEDLLGVEDYLSLSFCRKVSVPGLLEYSEDDLGASEIGQATEAIWLYRDLALENKVKAHSIETLYEALAGGKQ
ncbi:MAG: hypothetical protein Q4E09_04515 [Eubacteriales bacterium]|nr:hypothetical protein [Eubacteriales bacterium]